MNNLTGITRYVTREWRGWPLAMALGMFGLWVAVVLLVVAVPVGVGVLLGRVDLDD